MGIVLERPEIQKGGIPETDGIVWRTKGENVGNVSRGEVNHFMGFFLS